MFRKVRACIANLHELGLTTVRKSVLLSIYVRTPVPLSTTKGTDGSIVRFVVVVYV